jgi:dipeptidyl aminopeptidase/acylaminoacyl peptidase
MRAFVLVLLACDVAAAAGGTAPDAHVPPNMTVDGVPELPKRVRERGRPYQAARGAALLDWEPSGAGVLIATRFGETAQVHAVARPGGDRRQLTFFDEPVAAAQYGPKRGASGFFFRMDAGGGEFYQYYWYDLATGTHTLLTDGKSRHEGLLASNRGGQLAFVGTQRNGKDFDLYLMDELEPRTIRRAHELAGQWNPVDWSPGDDQLLLRHYVSANESTLHVYDVRSGELRALHPSDKKIAYGAAAFARRGPPAIFFSSDEDAEFLRLQRLDLATGKITVLTPWLPWDVVAVDVSPDGAYLAFVANEGGQSAVYLTATDGKSLMSEYSLINPERRGRVAVPVGVVGGLKFDRQSKRLGFALSTADSPSDVYSVDVRTRAVTRWTEGEIGGLDRKTFVTPERVVVKSFDGRAFDAWYYRARGGSGGDESRAPVIVSIHGGPEAQATAAFNATTQYWVNELHAAVLAPNVRGSAGYGKSFLLLDNGAKREDSVRDIGALLDWIATRPELDAKRVAVIGGSYGGYMVLAALETFGARLRCGAEIVGVSNFVTFLERTESYRRELRRAEYGDERDPKMRALLESIAPTAHADRIVQPLLVAQGANDPRVPASEAEQIVKAVRARGGTVWYMLARDEGHGFQKKVNRDYFNDAVNFFFEERLLK